MRDVWNVSELADDVRFSDEFIGSVVRARRAGGERTMNARDAFEKWFYDTYQHSDWTQTEESTFVAGARWERDAAQREAEAREAELRDLLRRARQGLLEAYVDHPVARKIAAVLAAHPTPPETRDPLDKARSLVEQLQNAAGTSERETNA